jgi:hypothetical protein
MDDISVATPCKYTDLGMETLALLVELSDDDPWYGKEVFAFDAMVLVGSEINSDGATITYRADSAHSMSLAEKIRTSPLAWWFGYWRSV